MHDVYLYIITLWLSSRTLIGKGASTQDIEKKNKDFIHNKVSYILVFFFPRNLFYFPHPTNKKEYGILFHFQGNEYIYTQGKEYLCMHACLLN